MYPFVKFGILHVQLFSLFLALGAIFAVFFALKKFIQHNLPPEHVFYLGTISVVAGTIGSRLFYIFEYHREYHWQIFNLVDGGWSLAGFFLGLAFFISRRYYSLTALMLITFYLRSKQINIFPITVALIIALSLHTVYRHKILPFKNKWLYLAMLVCGIVFARITFLYIHFNSYSWDIFQIHRGGMTVYGGFLLALLCCILYVRKQQIPLRATLDILLTVTFLALAFGRVGCFFNGCCFGKDCHTPSVYSVQFPTNSPSGFHQLRGLNKLYLWNSYTPQARSLSAFLQQFPKQLDEKTRAIFFPRVYATQLISALYNFLIFIFLYFFLGKKKYDGQVAVYGICMYAVCRFCIEVFRGDNPFAISGLTGAQCVSFVLFCVSISFILSHKALHKRSMITRKEI
ncbi:prolipoprotein diacylglyceryl transferase [Candidatus Uabimicrobium amorphum]|uniref:Prolipoprotein diacylglyceryl transferase n=1 Tax=Uabimicrobium amorphum TaxID=2596890 RepID=A0A5S9IU88_UABAM|nr:prolipoprotein diacylglyceryl transferase family protein [Candidatus Uabimicrobium amorphum]BBM87472.1 prolipoprotein diacylglyceryl transferase [Candidatus Uabimicrobium amorphum]